MSRSSGVLMHVSTLPGDYSCGALGSRAKQWIDTIKAAGFTWWQVLPFCLPDEVNSPYKSYSAFSLNPLFIDLDTLFAAGLLTEEELADAKQENPYVCEFERLRAERMALLAKAAARFAEPETIEAFLIKHPHTEEFCRFMALKKANGGLEWQTWETDEADEEEYKTWAFTQYEFYREWKEIKAYANENGVKIIGDMPIYVSADSADVWADKDLFQLEDTGYPAKVAGVPPDYFAEDGQLWGNPLYNWAAMKRTRYKWWKERVKFTAELFDGVRIDHFRAVESYYAIPATETTAKHGEWLKGPGMGLVNAIKQAAKNLLVIAEDLGDITDEVRALVTESGFPGMRVLQFGFLSDASNPHLPHNYIENCVAYTGTHDNNTLLGFVWEQDDGHKHWIADYFGHPDVSRMEGCFDTVERTMLMSRADLVILPVQDLLRYGADTRMNKPGEPDGNWAVRFTEEQLNGIDTEKFRKWNAIYGRC